MESIDNGTMSHTLLGPEGSRLFCKSYDPKKIMRKIRRFELNIYYYLLQHTSFNKHLNLTFDEGKHLKKELLTWNLWKKENIKVVSLVSYSKNEIVYDFVEGAKSYRKILNSEFSIPKFEKFVEVYDKIRDLAKSKNNPDLFHSDPHLGNFLYEKTSNLAIPIDSGHLLNKKMGISDLDIHLLNFTLSSLCQLNINDENLRQYISKFTEMLSSSEKYQLNNLERRVPPLLKAYFASREEVGHKIIGREKVETPARGYKRFLSRYDSCIKPILEN